MSRSHNRLYAIFVSSTSDDLDRYRRIAREVILDRRCLPVMMEHFSAESKSPPEVIEKHLRNCDAVLLIAGARYGSSPRNSEKSYVEWEFEQASKMDLPVVSLILSAQMRKRHLNIDDKERTKQEQFIERLREKLTKDFDEKSFAREIGSAIDKLIDDLDDQPRRGFISAADHENTLSAKSAELYRSNSRTSFLKMLSSFSLVWNGSPKLAPNKEVVMNGNRDKSEIPNKILNLLHDDVFNQPVIASIASNLIRQFIERLDDFSARSGFTPASMPELGIVLDELFGNSLTLLQATSIHSNHKELASYKGYWEDSVLGPFFKKKNREFLGRPNASIKRVYVCDSLADVLAEEWFNDTIVQHVREGAFVRVVQVNERDILSYEDYGIYEHENNGTKDTYLLLAPKENNAQEQALRTAVSADAKLVGEYKKKFDKVWRQSNQTLQLITSDRVALADQQPLAAHGEGAINDLFEQRIILRRMQRLDTNESLVQGSTSIRKYQPDYARIVGNHISKAFPDVKQLFYIGDTYKNDGAAIRNLQTLGWNVSGFICEPKLKVRGLWFNSILYSDRWIDLIDFAEKTRDKVGPQSLALFDIDQTLWAPKGIHDSPLNRARTQAIKGLVDEYVDADSEISRKAKERVELLYHEISEVKYLNTLTLDNEDYKAAICVFLALNAIWNQQELERMDADQGKAFFEHYHKLNANQFLEFVKTDYLPKFLNPDQNGEVNMTNFILKTIGAVQLYQYARYGETNKIKVQSVQDDIGRIFRDIVGTSPVKYHAFRTKEFQESWNRTADNFGFDDRLVLNKPAWDLASWMKEKGVVLMGLSDRPDEATFIPNGESLLSAKMMIYGKPIAQSLT